MSIQEYCCEDYGKSHNYVTVGVCVSKTLNFAAMFCAISGEPLQDAVVSQKSGHIYERRLITKYIAENGTEPITGDKLEESDLITIQASEFHLSTAAAGMRGAE